MVASYEGCGKHRRFVQRKQGGGISPSQMREYDQIAEWYTRARNPEVGVCELAALARAIPPRARVLDLGCGDGVPVSQFLIQEGFDVVALDSSPEMIARYRANFPSVSARRDRVQDVRFAPGSFDAVVAWGVLFHLSASEQEAAIERVSAWLKPDGWFLFTSGDVSGVTEGQMKGVTLQYVSLGVGTYRDSLLEAGLLLADEHSDPWGNHVYVARKVA